MLSLFATLPGMFVCKPRRTRGGREEEERRKRGGREKEERRERGGREEEERRKRGSSSSSSGSVAAAVRCRGPLPTSK